MATLADSAAARDPGLERTGETSSASAVLHETGRPLAKELASTAQTPSPHGTESSGCSIAAHSTELAGQRWGRDRALAPAKREGIDLSGKHWAMLECMRGYYLDPRLPINARTARVQVV